MAQILIVDDASIMRKNLKTILTEAGHTVVAEASNGSQAYIEYMKHKPDLVTMDITMPCMNGLDTLRKIKKDYPDAKIIIISSTDNNKIILEAIQSGAANYIIKPFMVDKVLAVVNQVLSINEDFDSKKIDDLYKTMEDSNTKSLNIVKNWLSDNQISIDNNNFTIEKTVLPTPYCINIQNNSFVVVIHENFDRISFHTLFNGIQGFLLVTPLRIIFNFENLEFLYDEYIDKLVSFMNKAISIGGAVMIISNNHNMIKLIKQKYLEPSILFYSNISDISF